MGFPCSVVTTLLALGLLKGAWGLTCLSCQNIPQARDCPTIVRCGTGEVCYHDQVINDLGFIIRNMGCRDKRQCSHFVGKRNNVDKREFSICSECCDQDLCTPKLCSDKDYNQPRGPICFHCSQQKRDNTCNRITQCGSASVCYESLAEGPFPGDELRTTGCMEATTCANAKADIMALQAVGRRATTHRSNCFNCCDKDLCNSSNCTLDIPAPSTAAPAPVQVPTKPSSTGTVTSAPVVTPAPCTDKTPINICQTAASYICGDRQMATNAGCLHYCKFC